ncbi:MAG: cytochrome c biogenesis protein [Candidatus Promineifilaceae bacterium]|jgi:heme exporter protein C
MEISRLNRYTRILNIAAAISLVVAMLAIFFYAPVEQTMGNVQRIFYFHVGSAWVGSLAFLVALIGGVMFLLRGDHKWDTVTVASVEIGLVFLSMAIVSGSVWGRPAWNTWWLWSPRLTMVTIMWLAYAAYFMLRGSLDDEEKRARFSAVYVIVAFITVILTFVSIRILRDIHPVMFGGAAESAQGAAEGLQEFSGLDSTKMVITLNISVIAFTITYAAWLLNRIRLQRLTDQAALLKTRVTAYLQGEIS